MYMPRAVSATSKVERVYSRTTCEGVSSSSTESSLYRRRSSDMESLSFSDKNGKIVS